jgi:hypothetical protein
MKTLSSFIIEFTSLIVAGVQPEPTAAGLSANSRTLRLPAGGCSVPSMRRGRSLRAGSDGERCPTTSQP